MAPYDPDDEEGFPIGGGYPSDDDVPDDKEAPDPPMRSDMAALLKSANDNPWG